MEVFTIISDRRKFIQSFYVNKLDWKFSCYFGICLSYGFTNAKLTQAATDKCVPGVIAYSFVLFSIIEGGGLFAQTWKALYQFSRGGTSHNLKFQISSLIMVADFCLILCEDLSADEVL